MGCHHFRMEKFENWSLTWTLIEVMIVNSSIIYPIYLSIYYLINLLDSNLLDSYFIIEIYIKYFSSLFQFFSVLFNTIDSL